jgi:hypothetical protein
MLHSISFLVWRERDLSLNFLAKDYDKSVVLSTAFIYDNAKLGIIVGDDEGNIQLMQENPKFFLLFWRLFFISLNCFYFKLIR